MIVFTWVEHHFKQKLAKRAMRSLEVALGEGLFLTFHKDGAHKGEYTSCLFRLFNSPCKLSYYAHESFLSCCNDCARDSSQSVCVRVSALCERRPVWIVSWSPLRTQSELLAHDISHQTHQSRRFCASYVFTWCSVAGAAQMSPVARWNRAPCCA